MSGNEALGKAPSIEEEMAKFKGFSVKDGEVADGTAKSPADERAEAEERERLAQAANSRTHAENQSAGTTNTDGKGGKAAEVALTEDEEEAALQALAKEKGTEDLSQEDMQAALDKALAAKKAAATNTGKTKQQRKADRYDENYRARRAAEREAAELRRRLEALETKVSAPLTDKKGGDTKADDLVKPDHTDTQKYQYGELDPKYLADLARYETLKAISEDKAKQGSKQQSEADAAAAEAFKERVEAFKEAGRDLIDDFDEVVTDTLDLPKDDPAFWPLTPTVAELILESDHGHQIAYDLASDPKEAKRVAALSPARQAIWFGQQEAKLSAGSAASDKDKDQGGQSHARGKPAQQQDQQGGQKSQARESKAPVPLRTKLNGHGGNRVPSSATTDFAAFEALATKRR